MENVTYFDGMLIGLVGTGKRSLCYRYFNEVFEDYWYDPTSSDYFSKVLKSEDGSGTIRIQNILRDMEDPDSVSSYLYGSHADIYVFAAINKFTFNAINEMHELVCRVNDVEWGERFSVLVATKCDDISHREVTVEEAVQFCAEKKFYGYYETSSKENVNVKNLFESIAKLKFSGVMTQSTYHSHLNSMKRKKRSVIKVLPWNWSKVYKWNKDIKKLLSSHKLMDPINTGLSVSLEELNRQFPHLEMISSGVWDDFVKHFDQKNHFSDVEFVVDAKSIFCHKIVLGLRSNYFKTLFQTDKPSKEDEGSKQIIEISSFNYEIVKEALHFCYKPELLLTFKEEDIQPLSALNENWQIIGLQEALVSKDVKISGKSHLQPMMTSAAIQVEMAPGLKDFTHLVDVVFRVKEEVFKLHKFILSARSEWFRALLSDQYKDGKNDEITITTISSSCFTIIVEYLYTGRVERMSPDMCIEILSVSKMLGMNRLCRLCEKSMVGFIDEENILSITQAAYYYHSEDLLKVCYYSLLRDNRSLLNENNEEFASIDPELKAEIIKQSKQLENDKAMLESLMKDHNVVLYDQTLKHN